METKQYKFIEDSAHGWLAVPLDEIVDLGIEKKISEYSYFDKKWGVVYLEEDSDMTVFIKAKLKRETPDQAGAWEFARWGDNNIAEPTYHNGMSPVRNFPRYANPDYISPFRTFKKQKS